MRWRLGVAGMGVCGFTLVLALSSLGQNSTSPHTITPSHAPEQADDQTAGIPKFYSQSRQVIFEAVVWDKKWDKSKYWIGNEPLGNSTKYYLRQHLYPPSRGLNPKDFRVLDNGVKQEINFLKEADFPAVDVTDHWVFWPSAHGTWGVLEDQCTRARAIGCSVFDYPSATYLIGYTPPPMRPGECRTVHVLVQDHDVQLNREKYCAMSGDTAGDVNSIAGPKLAAKMLNFAKSSAHGIIDVSVQASVFWGSGVLSLLTEPPSNGDVPTIGTDFTYVVEVHDAQAPATVHLAATLKFPDYSWYYPCSKSSAVFISGAAYDTKGEIAAKFADRFDCMTPTVTGGSKFFSGGGVQLPDRFDTQVSLRPGDYHVDIVATDNKYFGKVSIPVHVEPLGSQHLMVSDIVIGGIVRYAGWVLREATDVSPAPVVPTPLVSKGSQYFPDSDNPIRLHKHTPLHLYFEIYKSALEADETPVYYRWRITDEKSSAVVMDGDRLSVADWAIVGNSVIPIGLKIDTEKLWKGAYKLEVQVYDSAGHESGWRSANFNIQ